MTYPWLTQAPSCSEFGRLLQVGMQHAQALTHAQSQQKKRGGKGKKRCFNINNTSRVFYYDQQLYLATFHSRATEDITKC